MGDQQRRRQSGRRNGGGQYREEEFREGSRGSRGEYASSGGNREQLGGNLSGTGEGSWSRGERETWGPAGYRGEGSMEPSWYGHEWQGPEGPERYGRTQQGSRWSSERTSGFGEQGYGREGHGRQDYGQAFRDQGNRWGGEEQYGRGSWGANVGRSQFGGRSSADVGGMSGAYGHGESGPGGGPYRERTLSGHWDDSEGGSRGRGVRGRWGNGQGQSYAGRGPKGYQRSDERLKEQVSDHLMDDDEIDASEITVEVKDGEATLTGTVSSRDEKRAAEQCVEAVSGVREVINQLRVKASDSGRGSQSRDDGESRSGSSGENRSASRTAAR